MGFYSPETLVKDAQRHGLRFRPVDISKSKYFCSLETDGKTRYVRLGLNYVHGLKGDTARKIEAESAAAPFRNMRDLIRRVPELQKDEIAALAELGALNGLPKDKMDQHRRGSLWQAQLALQPVGELLEEAANDGVLSPLAPMNERQRTGADFANSGVSIGKHPMTYHREQLNALEVMDAATAKQQRNGMVLTVAGCVITRQRPGTAKGFVFLSLEDESGIINVIVQPGLYELRRQVCNSSPYLLVKGVLQSTSGVISLKAGELEDLPLSGATVLASHDFH
jgi:error-prone DNA polymerase